MREGGGPIAAAPLLLLLLLPCSYAGLSSGPRIVSPKAGWAFQR